MGKARSRTGRWLLPVLALLAVAGGAVAFHRLGAAGTPSTKALDAEAQDYVRLALAYARTDPKVLDTYYGPADLKPRDGASLTPAALRAGLAALEQSLDRAPATPRGDRLRDKVATLQALVDLSHHAGATGFAEAAKRIYAVSIEAPDAAAMDGIRRQLDRELPGTGDLADRLDAYRARFRIAPGKRKAVFERALAECRRRTAEHWPLPSDEALKVKWSDGVAAAWHSYEGGDASTLEVNPEAVAEVGTSLDMACHEGYPGHHAQFLSEAAVHPGQPLALEDRLILTRSPDQLLREAAAEYGVELALPPDARTAFLRDSLFPLAGFDPGEAARYVRVHRLAGELGQASTPILRDYRDGEITFFDAAFALRHDALIQNPRGLLNFVDDNETYVLGYSFGHARVKRCIEARAGQAPGAVAARWAALHAIVAGHDVSALQGRSCASPPNLE